MTPESEPEAKVPAIDPPPTEKRLRSIEESVGYLRKRAEEQDKKIAEARARAEKDSEEDGEEEDLDLDAL